jgi:hypothetical protein
MQARLAQQVAEAPQDAVVRDLLRSLAAVRAVVLLRASYAREPGSPCPGERALLPGSRVVHLLL